MIELQFPCPVLVGRSTQLDRLTQLLDAALAGTGRFAAIAGDVGTGKSRLCGESRARAVYRRAGDAGGS